MEKEQLLRLADEFNKKPRLVRERINSSLRGIKSDYLQGYDDAVEKACEWLTNNSSKYFNDWGMVRWDDMISDLIKQMEE